MAKWNGRQDISLPIQTCRRHYLVGITGSDRSCDGLFSPFPLFASNGGVPRVSAGSAPTSIVRGLLDVHSRYPPEADLIAGPTRGPLFRRLRRSSIAAPIASGRSEPGAGGAVGTPGVPKPRRGAHGHRFFPTRSARQHSMAERVMRRAGSRGHTLVALILAKMKAITPNNLKRKRFGFFTTFTEST